MKVFRAPVIVAKRDRRVTRDRSRRFAEARCCGGMQTPKRNCEKAFKAGLEHSIDLEDDSVVHSPLEQARFIRAVRAREHLSKELCPDAVDLTEEGEDVGPLSFGGSSVHSFEDQVGEYRRKQQQRIM